ncbi:MAG: FHA domain-containing protein [Pirellulales bacterium]
MRATLQVISSPARPRRVELRDGQAARVGRSEWADVPFPQDAALAEIHFVVACLPQGCYLRHLADGLQTFVNQQAVQEVRLRTGDQIAAGRTRFAVAIEGEAIVARSSSAGDGVGGELVDQGPAPPPTFTAAEWQALAALLALDPPAGELAQDGMSADAWIAALAAAKQFFAAARVRAHLLPRREAVWWGVSCVENEGVAARLPDAQRAGFEAARDWVSNPSEPQRRKCEAAALAVRNRGIGAHLANAVFWSGPTLGPIEAEPVPPDPLLTGIAVANALLLASIDQSPKLAPERWPKFLEWGQSAAAGKLPWPASPATR